MPGFLLHEQATVLCSHAGQAQPVVSEPRVTVGGLAIVTQACPYTVAGCTLPPPPAANGPDVTAQWISAAVRVTAGGVPVLLADSQSICAPSLAPLLVLLTQTRARGN